MDTLLRLSVHVSRHLSHANLAIEHITHANTNKVVSHLSDVLNQLDSPAR
jgi:transcriptional regulatory protein LevR